MSQEIPKTIQELLAGMSAEELELLDRGYDENEQSILTLTHVPAVPRKRRATPVRVERQKAASTVTDLTAAEITAMLEPIKDGLRSGVLKCETYTGRRHKIEVGSAFMFGGQIVVIAELNGDRVLALCQTGVVSEMLITSFKSGLHRSTRIAGQNVKLNKAIVLSGSK